MPSVLYLAMTGAEFAANSPADACIAWMACHFSSYGTGLSNIPQDLPAGSMLILNDRIPVAAHDPERIARQLAEAAEGLQCSRILLDFQRPGEALTLQIAQAVIGAAPCPVGVSALYAEGLPCPVLLPPVPLLTEPEACFSPWGDREIWLELAVEALEITVTPDGSLARPCPVPSIPLPHRDPALLCHYGIFPGENQLMFLLHRTREDLQALLSHPKVTCAVGLWQELNENVRA